MGTKSIHQNIFCGKKLIYLLRNLPSDAQRSQIWSHRDAPRHKVTNLLMLSLYHHWYLNNATNLQSTSGAHPPVGEPPANNRPIPCRAKHHPRDVWPHRQVTFANVTNTKIPSKYKQNKADTKDFKANTKKTTTQMQKI